MAVRGRSFEDRVADELEKQLSSGALGIDPKCAKIFRQKGYPSRDRKAEIKLDITIEVSRKGATDPFLIWAWECKDKKGPVEPREVEVFHAQLQQIGSDNTKGTLVCRGKFRKTASNIAEANRIGLARFDEDFEFVMEYGIYSRPSQLQIASGLIDGNEETHHSNFFGRVTNGLFVDELESFLAMELHLARSKNVDSNSQTAIDD